MSPSVWILALVILAGSGTLAWAWWRNRTQDFVLAYALAQGMAVPITWGMVGVRLSQLGQIGPLALWSAEISFVLGTTGLVVWTWLGAARLAGLPSSRSGVWALTLALVVYHAGALAGGLAMARGAFGMAALVVACASAWLLFRSGRGARRGVAVAVLALGLLAFGGLWLEVRLDLTPLRRGLLAYFPALLMALWTMAVMAALVERTAAEGVASATGLLASNDAAGHGVAVLDGPHVVYANPALRQLLGVTAQARLDDAQAPALAALWRSGSERSGPHPWDELMAGRRSQADWSCPIGIGPDGAPLRWMRVAAWRFAWAGKRFVQLTVQDDTEVRATSARQLWQATHDELTGLRNRQSLLQRLKETAQGGEGGLPVLLVTLDIDRFKFVNEVHGLLVGNRLLQVFARDLAQCMADRAEVFRLGEDEFALLAQAHDPGAAAQQLAASMRDWLTEPVLADGVQIYLDVSMGATHALPAAVVPEVMLQAADSAMHWAKHQPGTSLRVTGLGQKVPYVGIFRAEQALRAGLRSEDFLLVYQPKVAALPDTPLAGFEALARWQHPSFGHMGPAEFIPAAEQSGLIVPLGRLLLRQCCVQLAAWRDAGWLPLPVAVNVSPLQLTDPGFAEDVLSLLREFDLPPQWLQLEITESTLMDDASAVALLLEQLAAGGVRVALDDFGTGFSSLNLLRTLKLHAVKIDRSLIDPLPAPDALAVVRAICDLARQLGLQVIAEGIETTQHQLAAQQAGCQLLQGFHFARPLTAETATAWLQRHHQALATEAAGQRRH